MRCSKLFYVITVSFPILEEGKVLAEVDVNDSYVTPLCDDDADDVIQCL